MAAKKNAATKKPGVLDNFKYVIELVTDSDGKKRVYIAGKNGGTIRGKGGQCVRFERGKDVSGFKIVCTELLDNSQNAKEEVWPFDCRKPDRKEWLSDFEGKLKPPQIGAPLLIFKYSIIVKNSRTADPAIIIDKM